MLTVDDCVCKKPLNVQTDISEQVPGTRVAGHYILMGLRFVIDTARHLCYKFMRGRKAVWVGKALCCKTFAENTWL